MEYKTYNTKLACNNSLKILNKLDYIDLSFIIDYKYRYVWFRVNEKIQTSSKY